MSSSELPDYAVRNRANWTRSNVEYTDASAHDAWAKDEIDWGMFAVPESELGILGDVTGLDVIDLGCGTAYFSAWLAKRNARPVGVDVMPAQLDTARSIKWTRSRLGGFAGLEPRNDIEVVEQNYLWDPIRKTRIP